MSVASQPLQARTLRRPSPRTVAPVRPTPVRPARTRPASARPQVWSGAVRGRAATVHACTVSSPARVAAAPTEWLLGLSVAAVGLVFLIGVAAVVAAFLGFSDAPIAALPHS